MLCYNVWSNLAAVAGNGFGPRQGRDPGSMYHSERGRITVMDDQAQGRVMDRIDRMMDGSQPEHYH
jgi:hypothetical protein